MYGLPGQSLLELQADVERALAAQPPHLSLYQLTLEPNTVFAKFPPTLPDEDTAATMQDWLEVRTAEAGLQSLRSVGVCNADARVPTQPQLLDVRRLSWRWRRRAQQDLVSASDRSTGSLSSAGVLSWSGQRLASSSRKAMKLHATSCRFEFMLNALRLTGGVPSNSFFERTGVPLSSIEPELEEAERRGLLVRDHQTLGPSRLGLRFLSDLQAMFLKPSPP